MDRGSGGDRSLAGAFERESRRVLGSSTMDKFVESCKWLVELYACMRVCAPSLAHSRVSLLPSPRSCLHPTEINSTRTPRPSIWASSVSSWPAHYWRSHAASAVPEALSSPQHSMGRYTTCSAAGSDSSRYARRWQSHATPAVPNPSSSQWRPILRYGTCLAAHSGSSRYSRRWHSRTAPETL